MVSIDACLIALPAMTAWIAPRRFAQDDASVGHVAVHALQQFKDALFGIAASLDARMDQNNDPIMLADVGSASLIESA